MFGLSEWMQGKRASAGRGLHNFRKRFEVLAQYQFINNFDAQDHEVRLMNYGWIDPGTQAPSMPLGPDDEPDRYALQLYHRVAGAVDLENKDVLEVGSGRGGGAAYMARYLGPRLVHGVELCGSSTQFCVQYWKRPCLSFSQGDAERLRNSDASYDAIVNIESSHAYSHMDRFVAHSYRILRPGGHLLYADFRQKGAVDTLRATLLSAGYEVVQEEDLTPGVVLALDAEDARKRAFIEAKVPERRRPAFEMFAALKGTPLYESFKAGGARYMRWALRKPVA